MKSTLYIMSLLISTLAFADDPAIPATKSSTPAMNETMPMTESDKEPMATQTQPQPATDETDATEQAGFSRGSVVRSIFTSAIQDREPIDKLNNAASDTDQIFYFTELRDMSGQTATHRWEHDGKVMAEVKFNVRGPRWRVWSSKSFVPNIAGDWKVSVVNGAGETISEEMISLSQIPDQNSTSQMPMDKSMQTTPETTTESNAEMGMPGESSNMPMESTTETAE